MKNIKICFKLLTLLALLSLLHSCEKDGTADSNINTPAVECKPTASTQVRSLNAVDPHARAGTNAIVAQFMLSQDLQIYKDVKCKNSVPNCNVNLSVKNTSDKKILFDYTVNFTSGANNWQYEGFSSINPKGIDSIGIISKNCGWISDAVITVTPGQITFQ